MEECTECGNETQNFVFHNGCFVCDHCYIRKNPPKMKLVNFEVKVGFSLFNSTLRTYEPIMNIKDFLKCGWFLRERRESRGYVYYDLEYFGAKKCSKCPKTDFPLSYPDCENASECKNQITKVIGSELYLG